MRRREFITLLGGAALTWPFAAIAQRSAEVRRVGVLANEPWPPLEGLRDGMRALGYIDERGLHFEYRFAEGRAERYQALAAELVRLPVDAIVAWGTPASLAAKQATGTVPIVMISGDPIAVGLVPGLAHPGANVTGLSTLAADLEGKRCGATAGDHHASHVGGWHRVSLDQGRSCGHMTGSVRCWCASRQHG